MNLRQKVQKAIPNLYELTTMLDETVQDFVKETQLNDPPILKHLQKQHCALICKFDSDQIEVYNAYIALCRFDNGWCEGSCEESIPNTWPNGRWVYEAFVVVAENYSKAFKTLSEAITWAEKWAGIIS